MSIGEGLGKDLMLVKNFDQLLSFVKNHYIICSEDFYYYFY